MKKILKRKIQSFEGSFEPQEAVISMTLKSMEKSLVLFVHYTRNNMPQSLKNVINTPEELYHILQALDISALSISPTDQLLISADLFGATRQFIIPLEKAHLSNEDKLIHQKETLQQKIAILQQQILEIKAQSQQKQDSDKQQNQQLRLQLQTQKKRVEEVKMQLRAIKEEYQRDKLEAENTAQNSLKQIESLEQQKEEYKSQLTFQKLKSSRLVQDMIQLSKKLTQSSLRVQYQQKMQKLQAKRFQETKCQFRKLIAERQQLWQKKTSFQRKIKQMQGQIQQRSQTIKKQCKAMEDVEKQAKQFTAKTEREMMHLKNRIKELQVEKLQKEGKIEQNQKIIGSVSSKISEQVLMLKRSRSTTRFIPRASELQVEILAQEVNRLKRQLQRCNINRLKEDNQLEGSGIDFKLLTQSYQRSLT